MKSQNATHFFHPSLLVDGHHHFAPPLDQLTAFGFRGGCRLFKRRVDVTWSGRPPDECGRVDPRSPPLRFRRLGRRAGVAAVGGDQNQTVHKMGKQRQGQGSPRVASSLGQSTNSTPASEPTSCKMLGGNRSQVKLLEPVHLKSGRRAFVLILDEPADHPRRILLGPTFSRAMGAGDG